MCSREIFKIILFLDTERATTIRRRTITICRRWWDPRSPTWLLLQPLRWNPDDRSGPLLRICPRPLVPPDTSKPFLPFSSLLTITFSIVPQDRYSQRPPQFSMLARRFVPGDKTNKPGPGKYYPENVKINKKSVPMYSMGIRHSEYIAPLIEGQEANE